MDGGRKQTTHTWIEGVNKLHIHG